MSKIPWNSIAEGVVPFEERRLTYPEALASPCTSCQTAPCCTHLPLHTFKITNMIELDHAVYLLNFERIVLGLSASGEWSVYYAYPCRFLNRQNFACTVHNTPTQPQICVHYNPYQCWYKRVLTQNVSQDFLQIDRARMEYIIAHIVFDEFRNIVEVPDWAAMVDGLANLPLQPLPSASEPSATDPVTEAWQAMLLNLDSNPVQPENVYSYEALRDPCNGCQAYCCQTLIFPQALPRSITTLDFFKFCLGFPGVELGVADDVWSLVVKTTCRHLQDNRCSVYGQPERPLLCKYYDAWKCTYKINFGLPRPAGFLRVKLEQFDWLTDCFEFNQHGAIVQFPPTEMIRNSLEEKWRTALTQPGHLPIQLREQSEI
jgi:hypothetical protein